MAMKSNNGGVKMEFYSLQRLTAAYIISQEKDCGKKSRKRIIRAKNEKYKERRCKKCKS